jgi:hypothetical protein
MWKVIVVLKGVNGDITEMTYGTNEDNFGAIHATVQAMALEDNKWVTTQEIKIVKE